MSRRKADAQPQAPPGVQHARNTAKHGVSLARAEELANAIVVANDRYDEPQFRIYDTTDGIWHSAAVTMRGSVVRVISLRRAYRKEINRYV